MCVRWPGLLTTRTVRKLACENSRPSLLPAREGRLFSQVIRKHNKLIPPRKDFIIRIQSFAFFHSHFVILITKETTSKKKTKKTRDRVELLFHPHFSIHISLSTFCYAHFIVRIVSSAFFPIRIFPSAFYHPHFVTTFFYPPSAARFTETCQSIRYLQREKRGFTILIFSIWKDIRFRVVKYLLVQSYAMPDQSLLLPRKDDKCVAQ